MSGCSVKKKKKKIGGFFGGEQSQGFVGEKSTVKLRGVHWKQNLNLLCGKG